MKFVSVKEQPSASVRQQLAIYISQAAKSASARFQGTQSSSAIDLDPLIFEGRWSGRPNYLLSYSRPKTFLGVVVETASDLPVGLPQS